MQFTTPIPTEKQTISISHDNRIMLVGSCFTENIGNRLEYYGFQTLVNPCGILYNPVSIANCLELTLSGKEIIENDLVFGNGLWHSWLHHGKFSDPDKAITLANCNKSMDDAHNFIQTTDTLIITLGTAFVYELENGIVAANCHKMPGTLFHKRMTTVEELADIYNPLIDRLTELRNDIRILFTVSPIRHWKDGARQNTLSKAVLHLLVEELQKN
ncbi:MAG: GSCFA domain-containing protein, partial [Bacteroidales bacterium]|nr:GSCFA domain-containing protein [Bacteroidales bacterium]